MTDQKTTEKPKHSRDVSEQKLQNKATIGDYILVKEIGRGGYGRVWMAVDQNLGNFVAIKQIDLKKKISKAQLSSLMMEINLLKELSHPNIVRYLGHYQSESKLSIVMEYVENGSLAGMVKEHGIFPESLAAVYILQVLEGLIYLHRQGVVHRDIKAANILLSTTGTVKLADFGVATKLDAVGADTDPAGSPYWMAPELIYLEKGGLSPACDIWSLGCTVVELVTGKPPYFDLPFATALYRIYSDDHPPLPEGISSHLKEFLMECFQKDVSFRSTAPQLLEHAWLRRARILREKGSSVVASVMDAKTEIHAFKRAIEQAKNQINASPQPNKLNSPRSGTPTKLDFHDTKESVPQRRQLRSSKELRKITTKKTPTKLPTESTPTKETSPEKATTIDSASLSSSFSPISSTTTTPSQSPIATPSSSKQQQTKLQPLRHNTNKTEKSPPKDLVLTEDRPPATSNQIENSTDNKKEATQKHAQKDDTDTEETLKQEFDSLFPEIQIKIERPKPSSSDINKPDLSKWTEKPEKPKSLVAAKKQSIDLSKWAEKPEKPKKIQSHVRQTSDTKSTTKLQLGQLPKETTPRKRKERCSLALTGSNELEELSNKLNQFKEEGPTDFDNAFTFSNMGVGSEEDTPSGFHTQRGANILFGPDIHKFEETADSDFDEDIDISASIDAKKLQSRLNKSLEIDWGLKIETNDDGDGKPNAAVILERAREKLTSDFNANLMKLKLEESEEELVKTCDTLGEILNKIAEDKKFLQTTAIRVVMPLLELLTSSNDRVILAALKLINIVVRLNATLRDSVCLLGGIPAVTKFASPGNSKEIRLACSEFVKEICSADRVAEKKSLTLQMFIAARGLPVLVEFLEPNFSEWKELIYNSIDAIAEIFELQTPTPKRAFCYLFAKCGLLERLAITLVNLSKTQGLSPEEKTMMEHRFMSVVNILLPFSQADHSVQEKLCAPEVLQPIKTLLKPGTIPPEGLLKLLRTIKNVAPDQKLRTMLTENGIVEVLAKLLEERKADKITEMIHHQALNSLWYIVRLNPQALEKAAVAGVIPSLILIVRDRSIFKEIALPILLELPKATAKCREMLWKHNCFEFYLSLLQDPYWFVDAIQSISSWFRNDMENFEEQLKKPEHIKKILGIFKFAENKNDSYSPITTRGVYGALQPLHDIVLNSPAVSDALIDQNIVPLLLEHFRKYVPSLPPAECAQAKGNILRCILTLFDMATNKEKLLPELVPSLKTIAKNEQEVQSVRALAQSFLKEYHQIVKKFSSSQTTKITKHSKSSEVVSPRLQNALSLKK
jgi:serine/threonine protein kinase